MASHHDRFDVDPELQGCVAVVTGGNKGIGFETARGLAALGLQVVLAARVEAAGMEAIQQIVDEFPEARVTWLPLELTDAGSRQNFVSAVTQQFGSVGILVNNAGFAFKGSVFGAAELDTTLDINFRGTVALTEALLPHISSSGRVVFVSSRAGSLRVIPSTEVRAKIQNAASSTALEIVGKEYYQAIQEGNWRQRGFPASMYSFSKALISRYTQVLAASLASDPRNIVVTACCPGYVQTAMSSFGGDKTPEQGADCSIFLAVAPSSDIKSGAFYGERNVISYV